MPGKTGKRNAALIPLFVVGLSAYSLDRLCKYFADLFLRDGESLPVLNNVFHLTLVYNTGAAFGVFKGYPLFFTLAGLICAGVIVWILIAKRHYLSAAEALSLVFIVSGALGNVTDRIVYGHVIDFFDFRIWPVFNVADSFITVGVGMLIFFLIFPQKKVSENAADIVPDRDVHCI